MTMNNWMNTLGALRDSLPEGESTPDSEYTDSPDERKNSTVTLHVERSTKGRAGKVATIIYGFNDKTDDDLALIAKTASDLRRHLGTGGSHRGAEILIQGDRRQDVASRLRILGFKVIIG